ncbi:hypothetical protein A5634_25295 [Mycobacterium asiaticum]|uniref:HNH nuclease domain-containing protein n=1 Tax=Mycobacterium asiaticum TaxID=1790 RepID=A0A1A3NVI0_MYCAS|nr:HNH endonuclease signature motif containing protein [Mycobacterium asiaticum]OBK25961.1 hypothetical protein A5634_25295 [Mycobacterium asiaticum]
MSCSSREEIAEVAEGLREYAKRWCALTFDSVTASEWLGLLETSETVGRLVRAPQHALINLLAAQCSEDELGGRLPNVIADRLHITRAEARHRVADADDLGPRRALTGEPLPAKLTATAAAHLAGEIGDGHIKVIRTFLDKLPAGVDPGTREAAEQQLAGLATSRRPDDLHGLAQQLMDWLNPDGNFTDEDRARKRGITMGKQESDGLSRISGYVDPELRATLEAIEAKLGAPGQCNRDDENPVVDDEPSEEAARKDLRSKAQRFHDALLIGGRALLASGKLGQHNGLPTSIVVTATLKDLEAAAGRGLTGGGTILPMSDVIRLARHAHHYLAIFGKGRALALYHTKRLASPAQRLVLYAKDRGCSFPGCPVPGYQCEVHHVLPYALSGKTDANGLAFACGEHHPLAEDGWTTRTNAKGDTEWIPPGHQDHGRPRINRYHHPEMLLRETGDDDEPG